MRTPHDHRPARFSVLRSGASSIAVLVAALALATTTRAQAPPDPTIPAPIPPAPTATTAAAPAPPAAPYSLPWQLRPTAAASVLRSDTSVALYEAAGEAGTTLASTLLASYKVAPTLAPLVRLGLVSNQEPGPTLGAGTAFVNPIVGVTWAPRIARDWRLGVLGAGTLPIGMGGSKPAGMDETAAAVARGIPARSAMDNAMFAVNYFTAIGGVGLAWVAHRATVQVEVTLLQLLRVRNQTFAPESARTNATGGVHVGYAVAALLSLGAELRYQRWLSTPKAVAANSALRDTTTFAVGPRFHFKIGGTWVRPGVSYARGLDEPLSVAKYHIVQIDVPVIF